MLKKKWLVVVVLLVAYCIGFGAAYATISAASTPGQALTIDIPTKLEKANVAVDMGHLVFGGDTPYALGDMNLLANDFLDWNTKGHVVIIFSRRFRIPPAERRRV